jgi:hypothetical protein
MSTCRFNAISLLAAGLLLALGCSDDTGPVNPDAKVSDGPAVSDGPIMVSDGSIGEAPVRLDGGEVGGTWLEALDNNPMEGAETVLAVQDGLVVAGTTTGTKSRDLWIAKLAPAGTIVWQKALGEMGWDQANALAGVGGQVWAAGEVTDTATSEKSAWMLALDSAGTLLWQRSIGAATGSDSAEAVVAVPDGAVFAGATSSYGKTDDAWVVKLDKNGSLSWQKRFGGGETDIERGHAVAAVPQGLIVAGTRIDFSTSNMDALFIGLDNSGTILWQKRIGGAQLDRIDALVRVSDGIVGIGATKSTGAGNADVWLVKLDFAGKLVWQKSVGSPNDDWADHGIAVGSDLVVVGRTEAVGAGDSDVWVLRLSGSGDVIWSKRIGFSVNFETGNAVAGAFGGLAVVGFTEDDDTGDSDWLVAKLDPNTGDIAGGCSQIHDLPATSQSASLSESQTSLTPADTTAASKDTTIGEETTQAKVTTFCGK